MKISDFAKSFATEKHEGQFRADNATPYITHPVEVDKLVRKYEESDNIERLVAVAYLHDVLEETDATYYELVENFGHDIASMVLELTNIEEMKNEIGKHKYLAYKLNNMTSYALTIKLCDKLHNISDLTNLNSEKRTKHINDTAFIIDYLVKNRDLILTHRSIILDILIVLNKEKEII